jgi:uncharacterized protein YcbK (DUF882 family)
MSVKTMLSKHFYRDEFACKCGCGFATVDVKLLELLEAVRGHFNAPVTVTSGCRCVDYNKKIGGSIRSKHMEGVAADIVVTGVDARDVYQFLSDYTGDLWAGLGCYKTFTHVDARHDLARWLD